MSIPMVALKPQIYAGRRRAAGALFDARGQSDARLLIALGRADFAPAPAVGEIAPEISPQFLPPVGAEPEVAPKPKRQYKRRDMTAEVLTALGDEAND